MMNKLLSIIGFIIILIGLFVFRGPAIEFHEYLCSTLIIGIGILILWAGNKDLFKKDRQNNESKENT